MPQINFKKLLAKGERGQSLVELTLGFMILVILLSGLLDLGRVYFTFLALEDGAGEAALYAAIKPQCMCKNGTPPIGTGAPPLSVTCVPNPVPPPPLPPDCDNPDNADFRARDSGSLLVDWTNPTIVFNCTGVCSTTGDPDLGDTIDVDITYDFELVTPIMPIIAGDHILPLTAHASQSVIGDPN
jgi:hypothetical protein